MRNRTHVPKRTSKALFEAQQLEPRQLMTAAFSKSVYTSSDQAGSASISLQSFTSLIPPGQPAAASAADQAYLSTSGGTAVAGVDYTPVNETIAFQPGQTSQNIQIPVLPAPASDGTKIVDLLILSSPGGAPISEAYLVINHSSDTTSPQVVASRALTKGPNISGFVLTFSKDMAPGPVQDVSNYAVVNPHSYRFVNHKQWVSSATVPLSSAVYDPRTHSVKLTLAHRLKKSPIIMITDSQLEQGMNAAGNSVSTANEFVPAVSPAISPITDSTGNPIAGSSDPASDGHFYVTVGVGKGGKRVAKCAHQAGRHSTSRRLIPTLAGQNL